MWVQSMRRSIGALLAIAAVVQFSLQKTGAQVATPPKAPFDPPVRKVAVDLGLSEFYRPIDKVHSTLTCYYYPHFVIKELDLREKGAEWDAIVPIRRDEVPKCEQALEDGEMRLDPRKWSGYFSGVVGNLIFLDDSDGLNGAMAFEVVDAANGQTVFEDEAKRRYRLRIHRQPNGPPALTYTRGYFADCPLPKDGGACWDKIRRTTGLKQLAPPTCTGQLKDDPDDPAVIFYPVRVVLGPKFEAILHLG